MKKITKSRVIRVTGAAAATLALTLAGCATESDPASPVEEGTSEVQSEEQVGTDDQDEAAAETEQQDTETAVASANDHAESAIAAGRLAEGQVDGSRVVQMDLEDDRSHWDIEVQDADGQRYDIEVSLDGTSVLRGPDADDEDSEDRAENRAKLAAATVDFEEAIRILAGEFPDATLDDLELDEDDGRVKWEADMDEGSSDFDVKIDASSGEIIEVDR